MTSYPNSAEEVAVFFRERHKSVEVVYSSDKQIDGDAISLEKINSVLLYEPHETIIVVGAGMTLIELERVLTAQGQWIPTLVASESPDTTLGDAVIHDRYHPRAQTLGMLRTTILGGTFCTTDGVIFKSGSRVVKSVAGYDIHRAYCGSQGRFGAVICLTLKVQPKPELFFRFISLPHHREQILTFAPTVIEKNNNELVVELAGYHEDIEDDILSLERQGVVSRVINNDEWSSRIRLIREERPMSSTVSENVAALISNVRMVFDPKQILR